MTTIAAEAATEAEEIKGYQFYRYKYHSTSQTEDLFIEFYEHQRTDETTGVKVKHEVILWFEDGPYSIKSKSIATSLVKGSKDYLTDWILKRQLREEDFEPLHKQFSETRARIFIMQS